MRFFVTGANGFLGSNFVENLIDSGHDILAFSKQFDKIDRLKYTKLYRTSSDYSVYSSVIADFKPDIAVFFGWSGGNSSKFVNDTLQVHENVANNLRLLEILKRSNNKCKFVGVGSFAEYGDHNIKISEETPENPVNLYGAAKLAFKHISKTFCDFNGMDWLWVRPCYIYGKNDVSTRLIPSVIAKCLRNDRIELDKCDTVVDYLHVNDFCEYLKNLSLNHTGVFNICSGNMYVMTDIIHKIHYLSGSSSEVSFTLPNVKRYICGDNEKISKILARKNIDIDSGISMTINDFK